MNIATASLVVGFVCLSALSGCEDHRASAAVRGGAAAESAVERMVAEYCNEEASCAAISRDELPACIDRFHEEVRGEFDSAACHENVSESELGRCLQAVRNGDCGNPLDSLSQLDACRARRVCRAAR